MAPVVVAKSDSDGNRIARVLRKKASTLSFSEIDAADWPALRRHCAAVVTHKYFDTLMGALILFNVCIMIVEADDNASLDCDQKSCASPAVFYLNLALLACYSVESTASFFAFRLRVIYSPWAWLDWFIIVTGWFDFFLGDVDLGIPNMQMLRIFRVVRLMRAARLLKSFPELYVMIRGFFCAMKAMFWGLVMIMILIVIWSLILVEIVSPVSKRVFMNDPEKEWCLMAFTSVWNSTVLLFQTLVAGDGWGACAIPVIREDPLTFIIFSISLVSVCLGFTNLILAVIVDTAASARELDMEEQLQAKRREEAEATARWKDIVSQIDSDGNGDISFEELMKAYDEVADIRDTLTMIDISREDLEILFRLMDHDGSGTLSYDEFVNAIQRAQAQDTRMVLLLMKLENTQLARAVARIQGDVGKIQERLGIQRRPTLQRSASTRNRTLSSTDLSAAISMAGFPSENESLAGCGCGGGSLPVSNGAPQEVPLRANMAESLRGDAAAPSAISSISKACEGEFKALRQSLDERLEELVHSVTRNTITLMQHTQAIEGVMLVSHSESELFDSQKTNGSKRVSPKASKPAANGAIERKAFGTPQPSALCCQSERAPQGVSSATTRSPASLEVKPRSGWANAYTHSKEDLEDIALHVEMRYSIHSQETSPSLCAAPDRPQ